MRKSLERNLTLLRDGFSRMGEKFSKILFPIFIVFVVKQNQKLIPRSLRISLIQVGAGLRFGQIGKMLFLMTAERGLPHLEKSLSETIPIVLCLKKSSYQLFQTLRL